MRLLSGGHFAWYTAGNCLSLLGTWMQRIACSLVVWDLTQSPFWLGVLAAADLLPTVILGPVGGAATDRWDALKLNRLCQFVLTLIAASLAALFYANLLSLTFLISIVAVQGCVIALGQSAKMTIVQELVSRDDVPTAVAINSMNVNLARLVGPALAGVVIVNMNVASVFLFNTFVTLVFVFVLQSVQSEGVRRERHSGKNVVTEIAEGFRYVASNADMRVMLMLLFAGGMFVRAIAEMLPAFAAHLSLVPATGLAVLTSSMAFGSVMAGLTMNSYLSTSRLPFQITWAWLLASGAAGCFSGTNSIWVLAFFAMLMGYLTSVSLIATQTYVQLGTPSALRGRTLSVHGLIFRASPSLGALVLGFSSEFLGLRIPVSCSAAVMFVVALLCLPKASKMRFRPDDV
ncbi:MFS transporter [Agrobacterium tumefaciens]|nr:MFS transporter [Agrobacterium sp. ICMP 6402]NTA61829.1 MFS transporter [Agrobacterium tumefaciens]